jgi:hypothetical protein
MEMLQTAKNSLARKHCEEWKLLLSNELKSRHELGLLQRQERTQLLLRGARNTEIATVISKHVVQLYKLRQVNQQKRIELRAKQDSAKLR